MRIVPVETLVMVERIPPLELTEEMLLEMMKRLFALPQPDFMPVSPQAAAILSKYHKAGFGLN